MIESEESFGNYIKERLNENYEGNFSSSVDLNYEDKRANLVVAFDEIEEYPRVAHFVEDIIKELKIEKPRLLSDFNEKKGIYRLEVEEGASTDLR